MRGNSGQTLCLRRMPSNQVHPNCLKLDNTGACQIWFVSYYSVTKGHRHLYHTSYKSQLDILCAHAFQFVDRLEQINSERKCLFLVNTFSAIIARLISHLYE